MKTTIDTLQEESKKMALDESERVAMRESLLSYIEKNPVRESSKDDENDTSYFWGINKTNWILIGLIVLCIVVGIILLIT